MLYADYIREKSHNTLKIAENEGILPLTIQKSRGRNLKDYKIYGESTQNTRIGNRFNISNPDILPKTYVGSSTKMITSNEYAYSVYLQIQPHTTYTVSKMATSRFSISTFTDVPAIGMTANVYVSDSVEGNGATSFSITTGVNDNYMVIFAYMSTYDADIDFQNVIDSIYVVEHIPNVNTPSEVESVGEKVTNIFDNTKLSAPAVLVEGTDDIEVTNAGAPFMNHENTIAMLKPSTKYTISFDIEVTYVPDDTVWKLNPSGSANWLGIYIYSPVKPNSSNIIIASGVTEPVKVGNTYHVYKVFTTSSFLNDDANNFYIMSYARTYVKIDGSSGNAGGKALFKNFQVREGEYTQAEMAEYEPYGKYRVPIIATGYEEYREPIITNIYIDEPLRKIDNYADYIDFKNKQVIRRIGVIELNGVDEYTNGGYWSSFSASQSANAITCYCSNSDHFGVYKNPKIVGGNLLSNYFTYRDIGVSNNDALIG